MSTTAPAPPRPAPRTGRRGTTEPALADPRGRAADGRRRLVRLVRGRAEDPAWVRPALGGVLLLAALLVLWGLTRNGYANEYYAAATRSGSESWKAWFFGSLDPASFITVDKPPLSLWLSGLSARILGFSSLSVLLPQALCTIGAVGLLYGAVRRSFGPVAGIAAAAALALTPITVAIGRVNNPDALLVLLMVGSAGLTLRAVESGRGKHLAWAGVLVGLAFMTKMLQGWMILPALGAAYLLAGPPALLVRLRQLVVAGAVALGVSVAWPVAVTLWPGTKPYIGGSTDGGVWDLILGYNGLGRIFGESGGGGGGQGASFGGEAGLLRLLNAQVGGQASWLLPLAAVGLIAGLVMARRLPRTDVRRAGYVLFGVWALVHALIFSTQQGIFHPYYVSALAPAVAALAAGGAVHLAAAARERWAAAAALAVGILGTGALSVFLLGRSTDGAGALGVVVAVSAVLAVTALLLLRTASGAPAGVRRLATAAAVLGTVAVLAGPASWSVATVGRSLDGNNVQAGPTSALSGGMGGGARPAGGGSSNAAPQGAATGGSSSASGSSSAAGASSASGSSNASGSSSAAGRPGAATSATSGSASSGGAPSGGGPGGGVSDEVLAYLKAHQGSATYLFAGSGAQTTASAIVETGEPVVTIGGFSGSDAAPTVAQLERMVADGELKYVLVGGSGGGPGGGSSAITEWVQQHGTEVTAVQVDSGTLYEVSA